MDQKRRLSEAVYVGLCVEVGTSTEVSIRRQVVDIDEIVRTPVRIRRRYNKVRSGSRREGFRLINSDVDIMLWLPCHKVICDPSQVNLYSVLHHTVILMEYNDLPPGFTRLNLINPSNDLKIVHSCVTIHNKEYISNMFFRDIHLRYLQTGKASIVSAFLHGPCSTFHVCKGLEADIAFCFRSHHWPTAALPWIQRCRDYNWPSDIVVSDILSGGFHVVPIASTPENSLEWRISFSKAEKKIVYVMNHCQFLCYGLFKIFLKEVINHQKNNPVLCSYHVKTIIFWVIQTNPSLTNWTPDKLLSCFWECFTLLIKWVHFEVCPNFFIPQNNMFRLKVTGSVRTSLFSQLYDLYRKGISSCVLLSKTIRPYLSHAILNPTLIVCTDESTIKSSAKVESCFFEELKIKTTKPFFIEESAVTLKTIERIIREKMTPYEEVALQCITSNVLRDFAFVLQKSIYPNKYCNKMYYKANKAHMLIKLSCSFGCLSDILYLAIYYYNTRCHEHSLICLEKAKNIMFLPFIAYYGDINEDKYSHKFDGVPLRKKFKEALVRDIVLESKHTYIDELVFEGLNERKGAHFLIIPPLVVLHMLLILNHYRQGNAIVSRQYLRGLQTLMLKNNEFCVPTHLRDISWQILGICQQTLGDYKGSLESYRISLQQEPFHRIQEATLLRIDVLSSIAKLS